MQGVEQEVGVVYDGRLRLLLWFHDFRIAATLTLHFASAVYFTVLNRKVMKSSGFVLVMPHQPRAIARVDTIAGHRSSIDP